MLYLFAIVFGFASLGASILISPLAAELFGLSFSIGCAGGPLVAGYIFDITGSYQVVLLKPFSGRAAYESLALFLDNQQKYPIRGSSRLRLTPL
jgi:cyanate permease